MLVIDDALLLLVLGGSPPEAVATAYEDGQIFTTGTWYYRLTNAVRTARVLGALTTAFESLSNGERRQVTANLHRLPPSIGLLSYRGLEPVMAALNVERPLNMLAADATSTAIVADGRILVSTDTVPDRRGRSRACCGVRHRLMGWTDVPPVERARGLRHLRASPSRDLR